MKKIYVKPQVEEVEVENADMLAASGEYNVNNPFGGNTEQNW